MRTSVLSFIYSAEQAFQRWQPTLAMLLAIGLAVIGFVAGWGVSYYYSKKGSEELQRVNRDLQRANTDLQHGNADLKSLMEKMPAEFIAAIASDPRTTLTLQQLGDVARIVTDLQVRHQPRRLSDEQRSKIVESLKVMPISPVLVTASPNDVEAQHYRDQIGAAFQQAGWPTSIHTSVAAMEVSGVALAHYAGPRVWPSRTLPPPTEEAEAVRAALDRSGISIGFLPLEEYPPANVGLHIVIGQKSTM